MKRWKQRVISLLLAVSMVFGLTQGNVLQVEAKVADGQLQDADGIIWLTKNANGDNVSDEFSKMVEEQFKLDDMVRDALSLSSDTKVYFEGVDIGNPIELYLNMDKVEAMKDDMRDAVQDKKLLVFNIGEKEGPEKTVAFRNVKAATISAGDKNKVYINHPGTPASAAELKGMIETALNDIVVSVTDAGTISINLNELSDTVDLAVNKAQLKSSGFKVDGGVSYSSLLKKWPSVTVSTDPERKAGEVTITIEAAEYGQYNDSKFIRTESIEVWMVDQRVTVNAAAYNSKGELVPVGEKDAEGNVVNYTASYSGTEAPSKTPVLEHYRFSKWEEDVCSGYDYTAIMIPKVDNNKNGIHDELEELEEYTVTYYVDGEEVDFETVTEGNMPKGPESNPVNDSVDIEEDEESGKKYEVRYVFSGWETETGTKWPAKVTGDTAYHATWRTVKTEIPDDPDEPIVPGKIFTVTGTLVIDGTPIAPQPLGADQTKDNSDGNGSEYQIINPGWAEDENLKPDGYECIGWYYKDAEGKKVSFNIDTDRWNTNNGYNLELYCEFVAKVEVMDSDGTVTDKVLDNDIPVYNYSIKWSDGSVEELPVSTTAPSQIDIDAVLEKRGAYEEEYNPRITTYSEPKLEGTVIIAPVPTSVKNEVVSNIGERSADVNEVVYNVGDYRSEVIFAENSDGIKGEAVIDGKHTYAIDADAQITVTPFSKDGDIKAYLTGLSATVGSTGQTVELLGEDNIVYGEDYSVSITGPDIITKTSRSRSSDSLDGVTLIPEYKILNFEAKANASLNAGGSYNEQTVYNQVIAGNLAYDDSAVEITYKAQENSYNISLQKLFDLFEADGLGALIPVVEEALKSFNESESEVASLKVEVPNGQVEWADIEDSSPEVTAQEAANEYIANKYKAYKEDTSLDIMQLAGDIMGGELAEAVYAEAHHKFAHVAPGETTRTESLKVTYTSEKFGVVAAEPVVSIVENRKVPAITATGVTASYGEENVDDKIVEAAKVTFDGSEVEGLDRNLFVIYDEKTDTERDLDNVSATTYKLRVAFKGNTEYAPAISNVITLTVNKVNTTVTVEPLITVMKGAAYYSQAKATVTNKANEPIDAPIIQIVAGIATDELAYGLKTEGDVKDWSLGFDDENLMADVWVKLPQSYIDMLTSLDMETLEPIIKEELGDVEIPDGEFAEGIYYTIENLEEALAQYDIALVEEMQALLDEIPAIIQDKLGISDLTYGIKVRFDALEDEVYPTNSGFYVNYAATLSRFNNSKVDFDNNYEKSEDYGFIVISPMAPIPNRGGVQLYDGSVNNAQNIFVYEYNGTAIPRDLEVALNGAKLEGEVPFYYGLTTRFNALDNEAPTMPGVYFAGYNYTTTVKNEDSGEDEVRRLGSDSAIIIIKQQEANLTITGGIYEYAEVDGEAVKRTAEIKITDKNDVEINDSGVTVISGTVNVKDDSTNVTANDFYGTVNIDMPDALKLKWDAFWDKLERDNKEKILPGDFITFLEECRDAAVTASNTALDTFKDVAMKDAVSSALGKINVSSDKLVNGANKAQALMDDGVAYYNELLEQLEPLKKLNDNLELTFKDVNELNYSATGYYLYMGVITDPDLTPDAGKGLVIIHSEDDYIMSDTHVPYNGQEQTIDIVDKTKRGEVTVMVDSAEKEISFFLEGDIYAAMNTALSKLELVGKQVEIKDGSDVVVSTVYEQAEGKAEAVYNKLYELLEGKVIAKIEEVYGNNIPTELDEAILNAKNKLSSLTKRLSNKLQAVDKLDGATRIILYNMSSDKDLKGMPIDAGTYQFYGYDYDVSATRGTLVIEPIYILIEDGIVDGKETVITKTQGEDDPILKKYSKVTCYSYSGIGTDVKEVPVTGVDTDKLVSYEVIRTSGETVGKYDMSITGLTLLDESGNYKLDEERVEDVQDFEIIPVTEIPELSCEVRVEPSTAIIGIHKAEQITLNVKFSDTLGNTSENLKHKYFSHYDVQTADGESIGNVTDDDNSGLAAALEKAGTYYIVPMYKGNPEKTYVYDKITKGVLTVKSADAPVDPGNPDAPNNIIYIWVDTDNSSFVAGTQDNVQSYINPKLKVRVNGELLEPGDVLYEQLGLSDESYKLVNVETGEEVQLSEIGDAVGKYKYEITCGSIEGYVNEIIPTYITVEAQQLHLGVDIYKKSTNGSEGSVVSLLPIGADANNYEVKLSAWDNIGSNEDNLITQYIEKYVILDADDKEVELQDALNKPGEYTVKPIEKGNPKDVYGTETDVQTTTFRVSLKVVEVNPVIKYKGNIYEHDRISWNHPYPIEVDYTVYPADFWADDCDAAERSKLEANIDVAVTWTPDVAEDKILENRDDYIFTASGTDTLDDDVYLVNYGTRELKVEQIGAKSKIRPIKDSIFKTVDDITYKLPAGYDAETILENLNWSATDEHGNDVTNYITGLKVEKQPDSLLMRLSSLFDSGDIAMLTEPGTYIVTTVISDDIDSYSSVEADSITVIVEKEIGTMTHDKNGWVMTLDSVVYLKYYPILSGFAEDFDFANRSGVIIWTGEEAPTSRYEIEAGKPNTMNLNDGWESDSAGKWFIRTHEIYAKNLGDMVYIRPYVVNSKGEYVYMDAAPYYSPQLFAFDAMNGNSHTQEQKNVCAALLEYGASAQVYFGYNTDNLATDVPQGYDFKITSDNFDLEYKSEYADKVVVDDHVRALAKTLTYADDGRNKDTGVKYFGTSALNLAGAIRIRTGFTIDKDIIDLDEIAKAEVLYWNERDFANIESLAYDLDNYNWSSELVEVPDENKKAYGDYIGTSNHIVAKYLYESVYCSCRIVMQDGTVYYSGLVYYSPEQFALDWIDTDGVPVNTKNICERIIVYSEMAERCFLNTNLKE